jgi:hypothetical protein
MNYLNQNQDNTKRIFTPGNGAGGIVRCVNPGP